MYQRRSQSWRSPDRRETATTALRPLSYVGWGGSRTPLQRVTVRVGAVEGVEATSGGFAVQAAGTTTAVAASPKETITCGLLCFFHGYRARVKQCPIVLLEYVIMTTADPSRSSWVSLGRNWETYSGWERI